MRDGVEGLRKVELSEKGEHAFVDGLADVIKHT